MILAIIDDNFRALADLIDHIAHIVYCLTQACMQAQTHLELKIHPTVNDYGTPIMAQPKMSDSAPLLANQAQPSGWVQPTAAPAPYPQAPYQQAPYQQGPPPSYN